jgi:hypothetical protein
MYGQLALVVALVPTLLLLVVAAAPPGRLTPPQGGLDALVPFPDGSLRRLYAMESPESWFEDFGRGQLVNGRARVQIAADFALSVDLAQGYYVFLTPQSDSRGLFVPSQSPTSFEVWEQGEGRSTLAFSYRLVAKRKDVTAPRFERVNMSPLP